jgi:hypothetical protein
MSTHPNTILLLIVKPDGLTRRTLRDILAETDTDQDDLYIKINGEDYRALVMEDGYNDDYQITAEEGDIVFFDFVTYGYGDVIEWDKLEKRKSDLEEWAIGICERHNCTYKIVVTANYW